MEKFSKKPESISRRSFLKGAGAALVVGVPEQAIADSLETKDALESVERPAWLEKITHDNIDYSYQYGKASEVVSSAEALVIIDWQERYIHDDHNEHPEVQEQFSETQEVIIERVVAAIENGQIIVLVGSDPLEQDSAVLETGGSYSAGTNVSPAYPKEVMDLVKDYPHVHLLLKDRNSVADQRASSRNELETILNDIPSVRILGVNESICGWSSVNDIAQSNFGGGKRVILNPSELADSQEALESHIDAREMYQQLPKNMLFREAFSVWLGDTEGELEEIVVTVTATDQFGSTSVVEHDYSEIKADFEKFLVSDEFPDYFK
jgi:hypothetical protein